MLRRSALVSLLALLAQAAAVSAMNWEGHEDGPSTHPYDTFLQEVRPDARPLPSADCPVTPAMLAQNPYQQIPLPRHRCPQADDNPETGR